MEYDLRRWYRCEICGYWCGGRCTIAPLVSLSSLPADAWVEHLPWLRADCASARLCAGTRRGCALLPLEKFGPVLPIVRQIAGASLPSTFLVFPLVRNTLLAPTLYVTMSKRAASPSSKRPVDVDEASSSAAAGPSAQKAKTSADASASTSRAQGGDDEDDMGEFEDQFEDEMESESDEGEVVDANGDEDDEGMEIDGEQPLYTSAKVELFRTCPLTFAFSHLTSAGVKVDGEIQRPEGDEDDEAEPEAQVYLPGDALEPGQQLEPDQSAYEMLHRLNVTWPCLSFDFLKDHLGSDRQKYPHTAYFAAGTQADTAKNNELMVMKASGMHRTNKDGSE